MGLGSWKVNLSPYTPRTLMERIRVHNTGVGLGSLIITSTHLDPKEHSNDEMLQMARYNGVYRRQTEQFELSGPGVEFWLGDEEGKGEIINQINYTGSFVQWVQQVIDQTNGISTGSLFSVDGGSTWQHNFDRNTPRMILDELCKVYNAEWRVTTDFRLDAGEVIDFYSQNPTTIIVRRSEDAGRDLSIRGIRGNMELTTDLEDWVWKVKVFIGAFDAWTVHEVNGGVAMDDVPYRSPDGIAAQVELAVEAFGDIDGREDEIGYDEYDKRRYRREVRISSSEYDVGTDLNVGEFAWIFDPERGIYDEGNPMNFRGTIVYPEKIRCMGMTWPIRQGMGVYLRVWNHSGPGDWDYEWIDLTPYVLFEDGDTELEIGAIPRGSS